MSDLIPIENLTFNCYWSGRASTPSRRPEDPRKRLWGHERNTRSKLARSDLRCDPDVLFGDSRAPGRRPWGGSIETHIEMLKDHLVIALRLQIIHVAGHVDDRGIQGGQFCSECARRVLPPTWSCPIGAESLIDPETEGWVRGIRLQERWEGPYMHDHVWMVIPPGEDPDPGFIPCAAAFESL